MRRLSVRIERFDLARPFRISRGERYHVDLVVATIDEGGAIGRGEGAPSARYREDAAGTAAAIEHARPAIEAGADRTAIARIMPPGAARNAVDCALWALEAAQTGMSVAARLSTSSAPIVTALTVALDTPARMAEAAAALRDRPLLKVKLDGHRPADCMAAVRQAAPGARLIVDANEAWTLDQLRTLEPLLLELGVELVEQPLPAGRDRALRDHRPLVPLAADESARVAADVAGLAGRYQAVTIKLDKAGGLTEALHMAGLARAAGLRVMTGCMLCSSLSVAAARHLAARSDIVDLDGPTWLSEDRIGGFDLSSGWLHAS